MQRALRILILHAELAQRLTQCTERALQIAAQGLECPAMGMDVRRALAEIHALRLGRKKVRPERAV